MAATSHTRKDAAVIVDLDEIKGTGFNTDFDSLEEIGGYINHLTKIWPWLSNLTCTLQGGAQNTWGAWTRLVDSGATFFDQCDSNKHRHITSINIEFESVANSIWCLEIAFGSTVVTRVRWVSTIVGIFAAVQQYSIRSRHIPSGTRVYGRLMCSNVVANQTVRFHFRYYTHD